MKRTFFFSFFAAILIVSAVCCFLTGFQEGPKHQSEQELAEGFYWYEAVILRTEDAESAFRMAADDFLKYEIIPDIFHVTTEYKPEKKHEYLYGSAVSVHITGYLFGPVLDEENNVLSYNEGVSVVISSENEDMQTLIDSYDRNWHITGSYTEAAKYTGQLDFSNATPLDITLEGTFGLADSDGNIITE